LAKFAYKLSIHGQEPDTTFATLRDLALHAEEVGFEGVYVVDHLRLPGDRLAGYSEAPIDKPFFLDAWTSLAALGAVTSRVKLGPQVTPIGLRHPVFVAKWGATVDRITEGRLLMQVGAGHQQIEYESHGLPFPKLRARIEALREGIEIIRLLWSSEEPASYAGQHYSLNEVPFWPKPIQAMPEIWLGGASQGVRDVVADLGDGWSPAAPQRSGLDPVFFRDALAEMRERAGGRQIKGGALFYCIISDDPAEVDRGLELLRRRADWADFDRAEIQRRAIALAGSPGEIIDAIGRYAEAGVEYFTLTFVPISDAAINHTSISLFAEKVMPELAS